MTNADASADDIRNALAPIVATPRRSAVFFDLDGTLAPISATPDATGLAERTRELIARIADRYRLAGIVTGRQAVDARRIVGLDGLVYVGNHGFEVLEAGAGEPRPAAALAGREELARDFVADLEGGRLEGAGLRLEDKGAIQALHWRGADDEPSAREAAERIAVEARQRELIVHEGRKVIELRPPVELDKGRGLRSVLDGEPIAAALYAGDDRTDVDAFRALAELVETGRLTAAVRIAVRSEETPAEVAEAADLAVAGPEQFAGVLEELA